MAADASDESMMLIRAFDNEAFDVSKVSGQISDFLSRVEALFGEARKCVHCIGFTNHVIETLRAEPLMWSSMTGGRMQQVQPVSEDDIEWALTRMRAWYRLAKKAVQAEFPSFEICQSFRVFDLGREQNLNVGDDSLQADFARLAQVTGCKANGLQEEVEWLQPSARRQHATFKDNRLAWREAWKHSLNIAPKRRLTCPNLGIALLRFISFSASTSGIEQSFTRGMRCLTQFQQSCTEVYEESVVRLVIDHELADKQAVGRPSKLNSVNDYSDNVAHPQCILNCNIVRFFLAQWSYG